ncbi:RUN and FYVE domain-containing protein 2 isoform X2 [Eurytemora carolleeae]|uniref:RUN and FYVE domain-containing protein 2 isoform X2 n=1 Tax=Eurytemora carolleeae TaxID=1294199 RepID=UPI000C77DA56|nr:RUN and FYVE domain-containing protein 2 isoform X2 [Eurytemora carolleeae]|eukprot:XP_023334538.1 RUN and FYVE domain-containing protein 2-like isoform X2 [Eurytemora affinis]
MSGFPEAGSPKSRSTWLLKQFSSADSYEETWPDLLVDRRPLPERRGWNKTDPVAAVERSNLVTISQLVIKNLVDSSLKRGRQVETGDILPLHQFFIILELVFKHGFKSGRRLMLGGKDLWDLLQQVPRFDPSAEDIVASARELPHIKTNAGRSRVWFRLALMQKKLADYFKVLLDHKDDLLVEYYYPESMLFSEEATLLQGLLVSLNIVDFNIIVKDEELDSQETVIDLSMYLRRKEDIGRLNSQEEEEDVGSSDLQTIIDQKSYIEELNRNLTVNITNLQAKVERMTTKNMLMNEDLSISKRKLKEAEKENLNLLEQLKQAASDTERHQHREMELAVNALEPTAESELESKLRVEGQKIKQIEKELLLERQMKAECEIAMKLMEKDVHEKQDTIISLRSQLEDIKAINLEMYTKLSECKKTIELKTGLINTLEEKTVGLLETMQELDDKFVESEQNLGAARLRIKQLDTTLQERSDGRTELEQDIKIEREWRERLQESSMNDRETIENLKKEMEFLKQVSNDYENIRQENLRVKELNREQDKTLEELGQQLSWTKLQMDSLKRPRCLVHGRRTRKLAPAKAATRSSILQGGNITAGTAVVYSVINVRITKWNFHLVPKN